MSTAPTVPADLEAPAKDKTAKGRLTVYRVLSQREAADGVFYQPVDDVEAHDAEDAITKVGAKQAARGTFVAVPVRYWTERSGGPQTSWALDG